MDQQNMRMFHDQIINDEINLDEVHTRPQALDASVYAAPGFIEKVMDHTTRVAFSPNRPLAFVGAVGATAHFAGHGYRDTRGTSPNLMIAALAPSGVGKEKLRETNRDLAKACGKSTTVRENFASGPAIEDTLQAHPVTMYQVDEIHNMMRALARGDKAADKMSSMLLEFYSQGCSTHIMRDKAKRPDAEGLGGVIVEPRLTIVGTGTYRFYESINRTLLEDGLMGRFIVLEGDKLGDDNFGDHVKGLPEDVVTMLDQLSAADAAAKQKDGYGPLIVPDAKDAKELLELAMRQFTELARHYEREEEPVPMALWARAKDKTAKLALVFAISRNPKDPVITAEDVKRAYTIVRYATQNLLYRAAEYVHDTAFQADCQKILRIISRKDQGEGVTHRDVVHYAHFEANRLRKVLMALTDDDSIRITNGAHGGNVYRLAA